MSYDGGVSITIVNETLLSIMKEYKEKGAFDEAVADCIGKKYHGKICAIRYMYLDCAYVAGCPKSRKEVFSFIWKWIEFYMQGSEYNKAAFQEFITALNNHSAAIDKNYQYIEYCYYPADYQGCDFDEERYLYDAYNGIDAYCRC